MPCRYIYISHGSVAGPRTRTDLDAISSVALLWRGALLRGFVRGVDFDVDLVDYFQGGIDYLLKYRDTTILLADVPPEAIAGAQSSDAAAHFEATLARLRDQNVALHMIDHHPMTAATMGRFRRFEADGLLASADLSWMDEDADRTDSHLAKRCAAEMARDFLVRRFGLVEDDVMTRICSYAHDQDFGLRLIPSASRLADVIGDDYPPLEIAEALATGEFWNDAFEAAFRRYEEQTQRLVEKIVCTRRTWRLPNGRDLEILYALMPEDDNLKITPAGIHCREALGGRVAVLLKRYPFISIRLDPMERSIHAGRILSTLGGGGHAGAASAGRRHGMWFPYHRAHEGNFEEVVSAVDATLTRAATAFGDIVAGGDMVAAGEAAGA
jgi:oligoribonuclease NrnB/cAMP/cGMP phosphodiesterase (DHH superfamily)